MQRIDREESFRAKEDRLRGLLLQGLAGDNVAYREFLARLTAHLRAFVRRRLIRWPDETEDLVQEALLAVHNQRHTYDAGQPLSAWVQAIARYKLVDFLRRHRVHEGLNDPLDEAYEIFSIDDNEASEARRDLNKLLAVLPKQQRAAIVHTKLEGLSVKETAALTGMSESAIKVGVHRGLKALAEKIRGIL